MSVKFLPKIYFTMIQTLMIVITDGFQMFSGLGYKSNMVTDFT